MLAAASQGRAMDLEDSSRALHMIDFDRALHLLRCDALFPPDQFASMARRIIHVDYFTLKCPGQYGNMLFI